MEKRKKSLHIGEEATMMCRTCAKPIYGGAVVEVDDVSHHADCIVRRFPTLVKQLNRAPVVQEPSWAQGDRFVMRLGHLVGQCGYGRKDCDCSICLEPIPRGILKGRVPLTRRNPETEEREHFQQNVCVRCLDRYAIRSRIAIGEVRRA